MVKGSSFRTNCVHSRVGSNLTLFNLFVVVVTSACCAFFFVAGEQRLYCTRGGRGRLQRTYPANPRAPMHSPASAAEREGADDGVRVDTVADAAIPRRTWQNLPGEHDTTWKDILRKATDSASGWSILTAVIAAVLLSSAILLYTRPSFINAKQQTGEPVRVSAIRVLACALVVGAVVAGACLYILYTRRSRTSAGQ